MQRGASTTRPSSHRLSTAPGPGPLLSTSRSCSPDFESYLTSPHQRRPPSIHAARCPFDRTLKRPEQHRTLYVEAARVLSLRHLSVGPGLSGTCRLRPTATATGNTQPHPSCAAPDTGISSSATPLGPLHPKGPLLAWLSRYSRLSSPYRCSEYMTIQPAADVFRIS